MGIGVVGRVKVLERDAYALGHSLVQLKTPLRLAKMTMLDKVCPWIPC